MRWHLHFEEVVEQYISVDGQLSTPYSAAARHLNSTEAPRTSKIIGCQALQVTSVLCFSFSF